MQSIPETTVLQQFVAVSRYARWVDEQSRRETWENTVDRWCVFFDEHTGKRFTDVFFNKLKPAIYRLSVMPSMRALMTAGPALARENVAGYNCFSGSTEYMTKYGNRSFADTVGTQQYVLAADGEWRLANIRSFGNQALQRVTLRPGAQSRTQQRFSFLVTPNHRWFTRRGEVIDLQVGDCIPFNSPEEPEFDAVAFARGLGFGDGSVDTRGRSCIRLCGDKTKYLSILESLDCASVMYPPSCNGDPCVVFNVGCLVGWKTIPDHPKYWWFVGYMAADGYSSTVQPGISTQSAEAAEYMLSHSAYGGLGVTGHNVLTADTNYGPRSSPLQRIGLREGIEFRVMSIEPEGSDDVFCAVEPVTGSFTLSRGVLTGNCAYLAIDSKRKFSEALYILMCGTGVGFSCERQEIQALPVIPKDLVACEDVIMVADSKEGWAKAYRKFVSCLYDGDIPSVDYSQVRPAGARLKTFGGRASGPQPLRKLFDFTVSMFKKAKGRKLNSLEVHDIMCVIGEIVVVGGVRRSALISLSNLSDLRMREAKTGQWYHENPQRALANNSVAYTEMPNVEIFMEEWLSLIRSKSGERGIFNRVAAQKQAARHGRRAVDISYGTNPCSEILLRDRQFCNLSEVVVRAEDDLSSLLAKVETATIIGTIQSTMTNFNFIGEEWKTNTEEERLLGVSLTGIYDNEVMSGRAGTDVLTSYLKSMHDHAGKVNAEWADKLGITPSTAITCVKPSGTVSQLVDSASGIHPRHSKFYLRTVRLDKKDPLYRFMLDNGVYCEDAEGRAETTAVFYFAVKAPKGAVTRNEVSAIDHLSLWSLYQEHWCDHNPSITVTVRDDEWFTVGAWVYSNFDKVCGLAFLPYSDHVYTQAPFIELTEEEYDAWVAAHPEPSLDWNDLSKYEKEDQTIGSQTLACTGDSCSIL